MRSRKKRVQRTGGVAGRTPDVRRHVSGRGGPGRGCPRRTSASGRCLGRQLRWHRTGDDRRRGRRRCRRGGATASGAASRGNASAPDALRRGVPRCAERCAGTLVDVVERTADCSSTDAVRSSPPSSEACPTSHDPKTVTTTTASTTRGIERWRAGSVPTGRPMGEVYVAAGWAVSPYTLAAMRPVRCTSTGKVRAVRPRRAARNVHAHLLRCRDHRRRGSPTVDGRIFAKQQRRS